MQAAGPVLPLSQKVEGEFAQNSEAASGYSVAAARFLPSKDGVEHPVQAVLHRPMAAYGLHQHRRRIRAAGQVLANLDVGARRVRHLANSFNRDDGP